ncbi:hypothetical protein [Buchnera aphidicola]|uniref:hypothetical protein n=1 Tax=Buchnera aphidicola TaxID=9 RepID=UPI003464A570
MKYPINEIFETIQGEGYYIGTPSIFIRFQGCPVGCIWCDTKYTWSHSIKEKISINEMVNKKKIIKNGVY